jgi:hypothetical protein
MTVRDNIFFSFFVSTVGERAAGEVRNIYQKALQIKLNQGI